MKIQNQMKKKNKINITSSRTIKGKTKILYSIDTELKYLSCVMVNLFGTSPRGIQIAKILLKNFGEFKKEFSKINQINKLEIKIIK